MTLPVPSQGSSCTGLVGGGGRPPGPEDPDWNGDDDAEGEEDEELVADPTPKLERDMDSRAPTCKVRCHPLQCFRVSGLEKIDHFVVRAP